MCSSVRDGSPWQPESVDQCSRQKLSNLFDEFACKHKEHLDTANVKYRQGFCSDVENEGSIVHLSLMFNPSHLEIINLIIMGSVHACRDRLDKMRSNRALAITIHGDAAITGQSVAQETLNMSQARGYEVGGIGISSLITR